MIIIIYRHSGWKETRTRVHVQYNNARETKANATRPRAPKFSNLRFK